MTKPFMPSRLFSAAALTGVLCVGLPVAAQAQQIVVQIAPPPPVYEVMPANRPGQVWVQGHHEWRHRGYVWIPGHWEVARQGYLYEQPHWIQQDGRWVFAGNNWRPHHVQPAPVYVAPAYNDRNRNGVPDRYEHNRNRGDRDRDRDGVPNRYDRAPNDPYRR